MNERLQEYVDSRGLPIQADRQRGVIRDVKILGVRSRNGRTYLAEAIGQAVSGHGWMGTDGFGQASYRVTAVEAGGDLTLQFFHPLFLSQIKM